MPTLVCSCNHTMPLDADAVSTIGEALRASAAAIDTPGQTHHLLCRREIGAFTQALDGAEDVIVACTQEKALFAEVAAAREGVTAPIHFVNVRETGGWSAGARRDARGFHAKTAALLAVAGLPEPDPVPVVDYRSDGNVLIVGPAERVMPWAERLADQLSVTVLATGRDRTIGAVSAPLERRWPVHAGELVEVKGWLGAFEVKWRSGNPIDLDRCTRCNACIDVCPEGAIDALYQIDLDRCRDHRACVKACGEAMAIDFGRVDAPQTVSGQFDLIFDLSDAPAFAQHQPPQGYFHAGADAGRQLTTSLALLQMVGEFEKPKFFQYKESICAHGRNGQVGCDTCVQVCSASAISSQWKDGRGSVHVTPNLCVGCGACTTACPTGAITYAYPNASYQGRKLKTLLNTYASAGGRDAVVLLHNGERGRTLIEQLGRAACIGKAQGVPVNVLPVEVFHAASTGPDLWLTALAYGAARVAIVLTEDDAPQYRAMLAEQVAMVQAVLQGLGEPADASGVVLIDVAGAAAFDARLNAADVSGALRGFRRDMPAATFAVAAAKRETLDFALDHLARHAKATEAVIPLPAGAPFGAITVDRERCTLCMACVGACPSQALRDQAERPVLSMIERNCVQCGLCETTCPEDAIALVPRLNLSAAARQPVTLNETQPFHCIRCNKPFGTAQMVTTMLTKLGAHPAFSGAAAERLKMCGDCRVIDMMERGERPGATH
ncbi:4Fe-4S binding protein [Ralstonia soli]|uniref:4Fe-4S binding protein n=1 Tax=Ralstonia soli TaxID=2953896 RepID=A0ABT1AMZ2_9RALS|nr:4Fe-4S binding protein [Ralstonia soli]MCO5399801.1 4Fe-4S binding protein [Ralstonia soli]